MKVTKDKIEGSQVVLNIEVESEEMESAIQQAYLRLGSRRELPPVQDWGRWEGQDRNRQSIEIDVACRLLDGRMMTGTVKFQTRGAGARLFLHHVQALERLAASGQGWAHEALEPEAPFLFVSAAGFRDSFREVREEQPERPVIMWELNDLF